MCSLDNLVYATQEQLRIINNLGGERNAHRILYRMEQDKLISSIRKEKKIYYLSNHGKNQIDSTQGDLKQSWITHTLMRNDLYIKLGMPKSWRKEQPIKWGGNKLIPDATFKMSGSYYFVEIDNKQTMKRNYEKIQKYKDLSRVVFKQFKHHPTILWSSLSDIRKRKLDHACKSAGIKYKIY